MNLFTKQKQTHRQKTNLWLPKEEGKWDQFSLGLKYTLPYIKLTNNKDLLYSTRNYTCCLVIIYKVHAQSLSRV